MRGLVVDIIHAIFYPLVRVNVLSDIEALLGNLDRSDRSLAYRLGHFLFSYTAHLGRPLIGLKRR